MEQRSTNHLKPLTTNTGERGETSQHHLAKRKRPFLLRNQNTLGGSGSLEVSCLCKALLEQELIRSMLEKKILQYWLWAGLNDVNI